MVNEGFTEPVFGHFTGLEFLCGIPQVAGQSLVFGEGLVIGIALHHAVDLGFVFNAPKTRGNDRCQK